MKKPSLQLRLIEAAEFAADRHRFQRRKNKDATPYINHPLSVAHRLLEAGVHDPVTLMAALLHDTIEDTETTYKELVNRFGKDVADVVLELTDDRTLEKAERRQKQIDMAGKKSKRARTVKLADKIDNVSDILHDPPKGWRNGKRMEYADFCKQVVDNLKSPNKSLMKDFEKLYRKCRRKFGPSVKK